MSDVREEEFSEWFESVHGVAPFPWQRRLLRTVMSEGWPDTIALPTASGKTAILDVAVFALACQANRPPAERKTPLRIAFVVDRRIVVDGAFERARRIAESLESGSSELATRVAGALKGFGGDVALRASALRGGIYREDRWARSPREPAILCSTVDQVGSRLLHRGYGVGPNAWPIHAGLLGSDTLFVLDEAHCSAAFEQTLRAIADLRAKAEQPIQLPWHFVSMTATPREESRRFELDADDFEVPVLRRRLDARKPLRLVTAEKADEKTFVKRLVDEVIAVVRPLETTLVVVNRVKRARVLSRELERASFGKKPTLDADVILLTGRTRMIERNRLLATERARIMAGRDRGDAKRALVIVATQCVEVGADLDVDAMVTELAPIDALRQRLGRLDRLGSRGTSACTVVSSPALVWDGSDGDVPVDTLYGEACARTLRCLEVAAEEGELDGGVTGFARVLEVSDETCQSTSPNAPIFYPVFCDLLAQTSPVPRESPEPSVFLHGPSTSPPEVQIVFRGDLDESSPESWAETVALCPPVSGETLSLRLDVAMSFLLDRSSDDELSDLEAAPLGKPLDSSEDGAAPFVVWRGPDDSIVTTDLRLLRGGMTVVVPGTRGRCDRFGWNPDYANEVSDVADEARVAQHRAPVLRLHARLIPADIDSSVASLAAFSGEEIDDDVRRDVRTAIETLSSREDALGRIATSLHAQGVTPSSIARHPSGTGLVITGRALWADDARDFSDEDDSSSRAPAMLTLEQHLRDVEAKASEFAAQVGLSAELAKDVALAGLLHDLGKADPRFQAWLYSGDRIAASRGPVVAKSPRLPTGIAAIRDARVRAEYPEGGRHELLSVRMAESQPELMASASDPELVLHLVASHHGRCRPFAPSVEDPSPREVSFSLGGRTFKGSSDTQLDALGSGTAQRFFRLVRRYGWWGLSYLEACLRLADHRASESAQKGT